MDRRQTGAAVLCGHCSGIIFCASGHAKRALATPLEPYLVEGPRHDEPHFHIASDRRGWVDHLEMAGEGPNGVGSSVAFSAQRPKL